MYVLLCWHYFVIHIKLLLVISDSVMLRMKSEIHGKYCTQIFIYLWGVVCSSLETTSEFIYIWDGSISWWSATLAERIAET